MKLWTLINHNVTIGRSHLQPLSILQKICCLISGFAFLPFLVLPFYLFWFCLSTISGLAFLPFLVLPFYHFWFCLSAISGFAFLPFLVLPFYHFWFCLSAICSVLGGFPWFFLLSVIHTKGNSLPAYTGCKLAGSITVMTGWRSLMTLLHGLLLINEGSIITVELNYSLFRF